MPVPCLPSRALPLGAAIAIAVASHIAPHAQSADAGWPRWRGARFDGTASAAGALAQPFELRVRWKRTLGAGYSGVVVADGHAVTMFSDGRNDVLVSLSADQGDEEWRVPLAPTFPGKDGSTGGPVSTPAIDDGVVFALGPRGDFVAVRLRDGSQVWRRHLVKDFGGVEPHWGFTTSPLVHGDLVIVQIGGERGGTVAALNRTTGAVVWRTGSDAVSYQSPMVARLDGREQVVAGGDRFLYGIDPRDGREIWKIAHGGAGFFARILNPVVVGDGLLLTSKPDQSVLLRAAAGPAPAPAWTTRELKLNYGTPVVHGGLIFGYSGAFLTAVDATTGTLAWRSRAPGDGFAILVDGHLVVLTKQGLLAVAEANGSGFSPKASLEVFGGLVWTPPAFANGRIYARDSYSEIAAVDIVASRRATDAATSSAEAGVPPPTPFSRWVQDTARAGDAARRIAEYLAAQKTWPIVEDDRYVHFVYTGAGTDVHLRSDLLETGRDQPMHRIGSTDTYYASMEVPPDARVTYQFTRNLGEVVADPRNPLKGASQNLAGEVSLLLMPRADGALPAASPALRGRVVDLTYDSGTASAAHLTWGGTRDVHVYLPPGYDAALAQRYPTVYVMYGNEMLQDGHFAGALEREMESGARPAILVFVQSTSAYEYARTFREPHRKMFATALVPWIDGQFRTSRRPEDRVVLGADEAGFAAVEIGLSYPNVFGNVAAQSLFPLSAGDQELLALIDRTPKTAQRFYVDWGRFDPRRRADRLDVPGFSARVRDRLAAKGFTVEGREWNDGSTVNYWSARAVGAVRWLLAR